MKYVWSHYVRNHVVFDILDDNLEQFYSTIQFVDGKQYGLSITEITRVDKAKLHDLNYFNQVQAIAAAQTEKINYQLIYKQYPQLHKEGTVIAMQGKVCVPHAKTSFDEGLTEIS